MHNGEQASRRDTAQIIERAMSGSIADFFAIADLIEVLPAAQLMDVARIFCLHLDTSRIPHGVLADRLNRGSMRYAMASTSLFGLSAILRARSWTSLVPVAKAWPGIFRWMKFFVDDRRVEGQAIIQDQLQILDAIAAVIGYLSSHRDTRPAVLRTSGLLALVASLWMHQDAAASTSTTAKAFRMAIIHSPSDIPFGEVLKGTGWGIQDVAGHLLVRLQYAVEAAPPLLEAAYADIALLLTSLKDEASQLKHAIHDQCGVLVLTKVLLQLSRVERPADALLPSALSQCFAYIGILIELGRGAGNLRQAVRHGLLQALVNICSIFDRLAKEYQHYLCVFVKPNLLNYVFFRSDILTVTAALERLQPADYLTEIIGHSPLKEEWQCMSDVAALRVGTLRSLDTDESLLQCEAVMCKASPKGAHEEVFGLSCINLLLEDVSNSRMESVAQDRLPLESCGANPYGFLQSLVPPKTLTLFLKEMQREDTVSRRDLVYHRHLVAHDVQRNVAALRELAAEHFPDVPLASLGIKLNYSEYLYPEAGLFALKRLEGTGEPGVQLPQAWSDADVLEALHMGHSTLVATLVPPREFKRSIQVVLPSVWKADVPASEPKSDANLAYDLQEVSELD